jgi:hypothetical protein
MASRVPVLAPKRQQQVFPPLTYVGTRRSNHEGSPWRAVRPRWTIAAIPVFGHCTAFICTEY